MASVFLNINAVSVFTFAFSGEVAVDLNIQLVIDADFHKDLLNRSSNKFMDMEEMIRTAVRTDFVSLKGLLL